MRGDRAIAGRGEAAQARACQGSGRLYASGDCRLYRVYGGGVPDMQGKARSADAHATEMEKQGFSRVLSEHVTFKCPHCSEDFVLRISPPALSGAERIRKMRLRRKAGTNRLDFQG